MEKYKEELRKTRKTTKRKNARCWKNTIKKVGQETYITDKRNNWKAKNKCRHNTR
jgi:hypothetical protein